MKVLHDKYKKMWGVVPNPQAFLCTQEEYVEFLSRAIKNNKKIEDYAPANPQKIKNKALINSLKNSTSEENKTSSAEVMSQERKDTKAQRNIKQIKTGGAVNDGLKQEKVVSSVQEIRTVQSNKNLKKTRKAVIVRENKEHKVRTTVAKVFNLLSFVAVGLAAIFLGIFAGNMYIASKTLVSYDYQESDFLPINYHSNTYQKYRTINAGKLNAAHAFVMAEWALMNESALTNNYLVDGFGYVYADVGVTKEQQDIIKKVSKTGQTVMTESVTAGLISTAEKTVYNYSTNLLESYITSNVEKGTKPVANYDASPSKIYNLTTEYQDYRDEYGIKPEAIFPWLISEFTVDSGSYIGEENGNYQYQIKLNNVYSVINYVYLMMHMSGLERPPTFHNLTITFSIDSNFRFTAMHVYEEYQIYYLGLPAECKAETTYTFTY